jgi:hypothetical protein
MGTNYDYEIPSNFVACQVAKLQGRNLHRLADVLLTR